jgi:FkbM family methyltransferase
MRAAVLAGATTAVVRAEWNDVRAQPPALVDDCAPVLYFFNFGLHKDASGTTALDESLTLEDLRSWYAEYQWCLYFDKKRKARRYAEALATEGSPEPTLLFSTGMLDGRVEGGIFALPAFDNVISAHIKLSGTFDPAEEWLLPGMVHPGNTVIEVGANIGVYTRVLGKAAGSSGVVHAIEPFRRTFQFLTANVVLAGLHNVHTHCFGAGNRSGRVQVKAPKFTHPPSNLGASSLRFPEPTSKDSLELVTVLPLDRQFREVRQLDFLKIDVEDMEEEVLQGAQRLLQKFAPIIWMEHKPFNEGCYQQCPLIRWLAMNFDYVCETPQHHNLVSNDLVICVSLRNGEERWITRRLSNAAG